MQPVSLARKLILLCAALLSGCASDDGSVDEPKDAGSESAVDCPTVPAACVAEFCSLRSCGTDSIYDEHGCIRKACTRQSDCAPTEKCRPRTFNSVNCVQQQDKSCECVFGLSINTQSLCLPADTIAPCAECDGAALTCSKPGAPEAAAFALSNVTVTSCGGRRDFGPENLALRCDTKELCIETDCEKYTFDGNTLSTASGLKCTVAGAPP